MKIWLQGGLLGLGLTVAATVATYSYAHLAARRRLVVERLTLPIDNLPPDLRGSRIVHMSDFHHTHGSSLTLLERAVAQANALRPDLVALTGDFLTRDPHAIGELALVLAHLHAPLGVYAVLGNHDLTSAEAALRRGLQRAGITLLVNEGVLVQKGGAHLFVAGLDECGRGAPDLDRAMQNRAAETAVTILLVHQPDYADVTAQDGRTALQLSGHTHGGQVRLPFWGPIILPTYGKKYHSGLYQVGKMWVYTNRGLGVNGMPVRLNCPPEVTLLTLI